MDEIFFNAVRDGFEKGLPETSGVLKTVIVSDPLSAEQFNELSDLTNRIKTAEFLNSRVPAIKAELVKINTAQVQRGVRKQMAFEFRDKMRSCDTAIRDKVSAMEDLNASIGLIEQNKMSLSKEYESLHRQMLEDVLSEAMDAKRILVLTAQLQELLPGDTPVSSYDDEQAVWHENFEPPYEGFEDSIPEWLQKKSQVFEDSKSKQVLLGKLQEGTPLMVSKSSFLGPAGVASVQGKTQVQKRTLPEESDLIKKQENLPDKGLELEDLLDEDLLDEEITEDFGVVMMEVEINKPKKRQTRFAKWSIKMFPKGFWYFLGVTIPLALWSVVKWILFLLWKLLKWVFSLIVQLIDWFIFGTEKNEENKSKPEEKPENIPPVGQGMEG